MTEEVKSTYKCTEQELYAIADLGYINLQGDLAAFAAKNAKYNTAFVTALRLTRTNAMALPDEEERNENYQTLRNKLVETFLPPVLDNFHDLKGYIKNAWPGEHPEPRYESAGGTKYAKAAHQNWENVIGLNASMQKFISHNTAKLTTPGGMPASFVTKVNTDTTNFTTNYELFIEARETGTARTAKVIANNLLHSELMTVLEDGAERVFRNDASKNKNYVFTTLKGIVSPPGSAGLKVMVAREDDTAVVGVAVIIKEEAGNETATKLKRSPAISAVTDAEGIATFENADPGRYEGEVTVDGVKTLFTKEIDTGVMARKKVVIGS
jgi:hypothetical protein